MSKQTQATLAGTKPAPAPMVYYIKLAGLTPAGAAAELENIAHEIRQHGDEYFIYAIPGGHGHVYHVYDTADMNRARTEETPNE